VCAEQASLPLLDTYRAVPPAEVIRENQRTLDRSTRQLDAEYERLGDCETKLVQDIKQAARAGHMKMCQTLARDLVRYRAHREKVVTFKSQLSAVSMQMTSMASTHAVAQSMRNVTLTMMAVNRSMKLPAIQKIMVEFQKQSGAMELNQELMDDAVGNAMSSADDEQESELVVNQVLDEIGIDIKEKMVDAPKGAIGASAKASHSVAKKQPTVAVAFAPPAPSAATAPSPNDDDPADPADLTAADLDLEARLNNLKRDG